MRYNRQVSNDLPFHLLKGPHTRREDIRMQYHDVRTNTTIIVEIERTPELLKALASDTEPRYYEAEASLHHAGVHAGGAHARFGVSDRDWQLYDEEQSIDEMFDQMMLEDEMMEMEENDARYALVTESEDRLRQQRQAVIDGRIARERHYDRHRSKRSRNSVMNSRALRSFLNIQSQDKGLGQLI